jgi:hypothetical protein
MGRQGRLSPGMGRWPPPITPTAAMVWCGARISRVVTTAVHPPVKPATQWILVLSSASARRIAGRVVVRRRASIDVPAPGGEQEGEIMDSTPALASGLRLIRWDRSQGILS